MSERTPEQIEADEALDKALLQAALAYGFMDSYDVLGDFVAIAAVNNASSGEVSYLALCTRGELPHHTTLGLLKVGLGIYDYGAYRNVGDDDE